MFAFNKVFINNIQVYYINKLKEIEEKYLMI